MKLFTLALAFLFFAFSAEGFSTGDPISETDSLKVEELYAQSRQALEKRDYLQALALAQKAWNISSENAFEQGKAKSSLVLGLAYKNLNDLTSSLNCFLQSNKIFEKLKSPEMLVQSYQGTGELYLQWQAFEKAESYFYKSIKISEEKNLTNLHMQSLAGLGESYLSLGKMGEAESTYLLLLKLQHTNNQTEGEIGTLRKLASLSITESDFEKADNYNNQRLEKAITSGDTLTQAYVYNSLGFSKKKQGKTEEALTYFQKSLLAFKQADQKNPLVITNMGVAYTHLDDYNAARKSFQEAKSIFQKANDLLGVARSLNYLAANSFINGNSEQAVKEVNQAIELAKASNHLETLQESYKILSEIYNHEENFKDAQQYYKLHKEITDQLEKEKREEAEKMSQNLLEAEKKENEFQMLMAEKEKQELAYRQLRLEAEKKEQALAIQDKELELLKQQQELQETRIKAEQLEKERVRQALALAQKQLEAEKRQQEIETLEREKEKQTLELKQKELEEKERQKALELIEAENKLKDQKLEEEALQRTFSYWFFALIVLILGIILYGFYQKQKAAKILKKQSEEIKEKNAELSQKNNQLMVTEEELRQNMEELQSTQEALEEQNLTLAYTYQELEEKNTALTDSIRYAETIQSAILPTSSQLQAHFADHMVIYIPKDVVSGDFYWMAHFEETTIMAVVDCTGHGVPGAFMSMIGASLLNQIINEKRITDPAIVLEMMNKGVRRSLRQKDSSNTDGMDLLLVTINYLPENKKVRVRFGGAKTTLYFYAQNHLAEVKGDRKTIGGFLYDQANKKFETKELILQKGDALFMTTDGFIDAANHERKRFGSILLKKTLEKNGDKPMGFIKDALEAELHKHQGLTPQRDDITLVGLRL